MTTPDNSYIEKAHKLASEFVKTHGCFDSNGQFLLAFPRGEDGEQAAIEALVGLFSQQIKDSQILDWLLSKETKNCGIVIDEDHLKFHHIVETLVFSKDYAEYGEGAYLLSREAIEMAMSEEIFEKHE